MELVENSDRLVAVVRQQKHKEVYRYNHANYCYSSNPLRVHLCCLEKDSLVYAHTCMWCCSSGDISPFLVFMILFVVRFESNSST